MGESFVDVTYRGLELGKRLRLRDLRPEAGYLEIPLPMPVGTHLILRTDEGLEIPAHVTAVHEQVAGGDVHPGMRLKPHLGGAAVSWWQSRIDQAAVAAEDAARRIAEQKAAEQKAAEQQAASVKSTMVMSTDAVEAALAAGDAVEGYVDDGHRTEVMAAVDPEALAGVKSTTVMDAIDISMITGEPPPDVGLATADDDEAEISVEDESDGEVSGEMPATPSGKIKKRGRRSKRNKVKR
jgi:hypothetical protein